MEKKIFKIAEQDNKKRIDIFLAEKTGFSRSHIKKLCDDELVTCNNKIVKAKDRKSVV